MANKCLIAAATCLTLLLCCYSTTVVISGSPPPSPARLPAARLDGLLEEARHAMNVSRNASMQTLQDMAGARRCR